MIKKIHCCWFGSPVPQVVANNISRWKQLNPDFEIHLYVENDVDVSEFSFAQKYLLEKKWGFLVDLVRPKALYEQGGVYIDADVELIRPLSDLEPWGDKLILGYMYKCALGTAVCYSPPRHPYLKDILGKYKKYKIERQTVSNSIFTEYFINSVPEFLLNGKEWENDKCKIFPKEFFEQPSFRRTKGVSIHYCCGSWRSKSHFGFAQETSLFAHYNRWIRRKYTTWKACRCNEFTSVYKAACKGIRIHFDASAYYEAN